MSIQDQISLVIRVIRSINGEREAIVQMAIRKTVLDIMAQKKVIEDAQNEIARLENSLKTIKPDLIPENLIQLTNDTTTDPSELP